MDDLEARHAEPVSAGQNEPPPASRNVRLTRSTLGAKLLAEERASQDVTKKSQFLRNAELQAKKRTPPSSASVTPAGALEVRMWALPNPQREYHADAVVVKSMLGAPTIYFCQLHPGTGELLHSVAVRMPPAQFKVSVASFAEVFERLGSNLAAWGNPSMQPPIIDLSSLRSEMFQCLSATVIRGGSADQWAMLDFYNSELFFAKRLEIDPNADRFVHPVIRVYLTPMMFAAFYSQAGNV